MTGVNEAKKVNEYTGRRWWNQVKSDYPDEFREYVDSILTEDCLTENREMIDALMPAGHEDELTADSGTLRT